MDAERDELTQSLSFYARKVFYGDITIDEVPKNFIENVKKELKDNELEYLFE